MDFPSFAFPNRAIKGQSLFVIESANIGYTGKKCENTGGWKLDFWCPKIPKETDIPAVYIGI
uniref:Uncharacterized protein n=1 Tax=Solanum tuberosum TaxID=4113 RepID=M0ZPF2_SOLTU